MVTIQNYLADGADAQSVAVLAYLGNNDGIEESWNKERGEYEAKIRVSRWENCREQGYVCYMRTKDYSKQLNIIFFEHRNSDAICAVKWEQTTTNAPTIDTAEFGSIYQDKYDTSFNTSYGEVLKMAEWVEQQFINFWEPNQ